MGKKKHVRKLQRAQALREREAIFAEAKHFADEIGLDIDLDSGCSYCAYGLATIILEYKERGAHLLQAAPHC